MTYVYLICTKVGHHFESQITSAEFYVRSDALVHLKASTEYLSKNCRTVGWMPCPASSRGQSTTEATPARRVKCIMNNYK